MQLWKLKRSMMAVVAVVALAPAASALPISGLFDTGVDASGTVLPSGSAEIHYAVSGPMTPVLVKQRPGWPAAPAGAEWIGLGFSAPAGVWTYSLSFDLSGLDATTAALSGLFTADDHAEILLNGASTGIAISGGPASLTPFAIHTGFVAGVNVLAFRVTNQTALTPTGLLVADLAGSASGAAPVPEPSTALLLGLGLAGVARMGRRRR